jgi:hypothetical protein
MRFVSVAIILCFALALGACGGPDVASIEGEYFSGDYANRRPFQITGEQADELAELVSGREPVEHLNWQGAAVFTIKFKNGTQQEIEVPEADAVIIERKAYKADRAAILRIIRANVGP